nr:MAG: RNA-dependent RNA polymerase [Riboviria sp.]
MINKMDWDTAANAARAEKSVRAMLSYDSAHVPPISPWKGDPSLFSMLQGARVWLTRTLNGFSLPTHATRFPSGESSVSSRGHTDLYDKLASDDQWTSSAGCIDYAAYLCYNTLGLKRAVRARYRKLYPYLDMHSNNPHKGHGFKVFRSMFKAVVSIDTGRITTVPKDSKNDRVISMEPTFSMVCQLQLAQGLRDCLLRNRGIDLNNQANVNRSLTSNKSKATVDLSNASNSNWQWLIDAIWPEHVLKHLKQFRSDTFEYKGEYYCLNMFSPMGNGFTFELMTLTLLALTRQLDPASEVFGDDIVIDADRFNDLIDLLGKTGWVVNTSKTFATGSFRESCGFFHTEADGFIKSYDFKWPSNPGLYDYLTIGNKAFRILQANQVSPPLRAILLRLYCEILRECSRFAVDHVGWDELPDGVLLSHRRFLPSHKRADDERSAAVAAVYHRPLDYVTRSVITLSNSRVRTQELDHILRGLFITRGVYTPTVRGSSREIETTCDRFSGTPVKALMRHIE